MNRTTKTSKPALDQEPNFSLPKGEPDGLMAQFFHDEFFATAINSVLKKTSDAIAGEATLAFFRAKDWVPFDEATTSLAFVTFLGILASRLPLWMHDELVRSGGVRRTASGKNKPAVDETSLLTVQQVMDRLQVSQNYVYELIRREEVEGILLSARAVRVVQSSVDHYIQEGRVRRFGTAPKPAPVSSGGPVKRGRKR